MDDHLSKPIALEALAAILEKWGSGRPVAHPETSIHLAG